METGKMITHLHNEHDYRFVDCSIKHEHSPACFELLNSHFYYITDTKLMHKDDDALLPTINLLEFRRVNIQQTQARKIAKSRGSTIDSTEASDSMSITAPSVASSMGSFYLSASMPASAPSAPSMPASAPSTSSMPASLSNPTESAIASDIRACMAAFASTHSDTAGVAEYTELLIDLDIPVSESASIETPDLVAMEICWKPRDLVRWKSFAKKWAATHV